MTERQDGYYWVLILGTGALWEIAEWRDGYWHRFDRAVKYYDLNFSKIGDQVHNIFLENK